MSKAIIIGWIISSAGAPLWLYGYWVTGNPSLIDWHANTPWWIADFLPNFESEIGMALALEGPGELLRRGHESFCRMRLVHPSYSAVEM
jgi:hypothetical protein